MNDRLEKIYGNRLRLRVCGVLTKGQSILLVKHNFGPKGKLWIPPGGEVQFGESMNEALKREFFEETGLDIRIGAQLFSFEYINPPYHAVEIFFKISEFSGDVITGYDPETEDRVIQEVKFVSFDELSLMDNEELHGSFSVIKNPSDLENLRGNHIYQVHK